MITLLKWGVLLEAVEKKRDIQVGDKIIKITPKLRKKDYLECLYDIGKESEKDYFECFGENLSALTMYPTIRGIKEEFKISYKELINTLSDTKNIKLIKRVGHSSVDTTLKCYSKSNKKVVSNNLNNKQKKKDIPKEMPSLDYIEFMISFGDNKELYEKLKPMKEELSCSWKAIRNLKWGNIDFENKTVTIETDEIEIC